MQLPLELLTEAKEQLKIKQPELPFKINGKLIELDINFLCPFCNYISQKNSQGSARVFSENMWFKCFACGEERSVV